MKCYVFFIIILLASNISAQEKPLVIGEIEFFGYSGTDLNKVKTALPFKEGDEFVPESFFAKADRTNETIKGISGRVSTDLAPVCCDDRGGWIIFIGLSGKTPSYHQPSGSKIHLPPSLMALYKKFLDLNQETAQKGTSTEDHSRGYALSSSSPLRAVQLELRASALKYEMQSRAVLAGSVDDEQRTVAAELVGYARQSRSQIAALVRARQDPSSAVRNNATRALLVLVDSNPKLAAQIPATPFIDLLLSGTWSDINKGSYLLSYMTKTRSKRVLGPLQKKEILERLIEMARWRVGHASAARYLLGRLAGIEESKLEGLVKSGQVEEIIGQLKNGNLQNRNF
jgi:hypothetical protein